MITWLAIKSMLGGFVSFLMRYPLQIILVLVCLYAYHEKTAHEAAVQALATLKADIAKETGKQVAENAIKHINAQNKVDSAASQATFDMTRLNLDRTQSTKAIKDLYETKNNQLKRDIVQRTNGVLPSVGDTGATSEIASDTKEPTGSESECNAALAKSEADYKTLENACTITTIDFNTARAIIDADSLMYGREDSAE